MSVSPRPVEDAAAATRTSKASLIAEVARLRALVDAREATLAERDQDIADLRAAAAAVPERPKTPIPVPDARDGRIFELEAEVLSLKALVDAIRAKDVALQTAHAAELKKKDARIKELLGALGVHTQVL